LTKGGWGCQGAPPLGVEAGQEQEPEAIELCQPCAPPGHKEPDELDFFSWDEATQLALCLGCKKTVPLKNAYWHWLYHPSPTHHTTHPWFED